MKDIDKDTIIDLTIKEIDEYGYKNISLRNISSKLDITTGSFYKRFINKDDLFINVGIVLSRRVYLKIYNQIDHYKENPKEALLNLGINIIKLFNNQKNLMEFLFFNPNILGAYSDENIEKDFKLLKITKEIISMCIDKEKVNDTFVQLWSFIQGYGYLISNNVCEIDLLIIKDALNKLVGSDKNE
ncbi:TetR/AcrR family transcriptional regulator [Apilactobacillus timberlakei]|uniref:TetR/AcrR family transcriptional regulator n=1 Tax=Apilactobacillus timberlakei TaxID=2008380 RepID=UPI0015E82FCA|nr:TetR/AcrR family transcriptional regulator [Apilactobacillus timberlakei]